MTYSCFKNNKIKEVIMSCKINTNNKIIGTVCQEGNDEIDEFGEDCVVVTKEAL